jgi:hypothetical protein
MSQVVGYPCGGIELGKNRVRLLTGIGAPSASSTADVQSAGVGSIYSQTDAIGLWVCSAPATFQNGVLLSAAVWSQVTIP